ncbi:hypothetical protein LINPERHAP1_LOCUS25045, partial [Linum perenne]
MTLPNRERVDLESMVICRFPKEILRMRILASALCFMTVRRSGNRAAPSVARMALRYLP